MFTFEEFSLEEVAPHTTSPLAIGEYLSTTFSSYGKSTLNTCTLLLSTSSEAYLEDSRVSPPLIRLLGGRFFAKGDCDLLLRSATLHTQGLVSVVMYGWESRADVVVHEGQATLTTPHDEYLLSPNPTGTTSAIATTYHLTNESITSTPFAFDGTPEVRAWYTWATHFFEL